MTNYFNIERQKELKKVIDEWLNTPFKHRTGVKGLGCDCFHFVFKVLEEIGYLDFSTIEVPDYSKDWNNHTTEELLIKIITKYTNGSLFEFKISELENGDFLISHYGKVAAHVSIFFDNYVYQSINYIGVKKININDDRFLNKMKYIYRITE